MAEPHTDDPVLANLNAAQLEAVAHGNSPLLIVAGAGSGKTRTLVHRILPDSAWCPTWSGPASDFHPPRGGRTRDGKTGDKLRLPCLELIGISPLCVLRALIPTFSMACPNCCC